MATTLDIVKLSIPELIAEWKAQYCRTTGKNDLEVSYSKGWFTVHFIRKMRLPAVRRAVVTLRQRPTVEKVL